jgi:hypothetical protein
LAAGGSEGVPRKLAIPTTPAPASLEDVPTIATLPNPGDNACALNAGLNFVTISSFDFGEFVPIPMRGPGAWTTMEFPSVDDEVHTGIVPVVPLPVTCEKAVALSNASANAEIRPFMVPPLRVRRKRRDVKEGAIILLTIGRTAGKLFRNPH